MNYSPIVLFVYNRPEHTKKTVEALKNNSLAKDSELFIFSDGPKNTESTAKVMEVREYVKNIKGFKNVEVTERDHNLGLAKSITSGVSEIVNHYGKVIVLEDDLATSSHFLEYMNEALNLYENEDKVISIHGYIYPVKKELPETFFIRGADCWGWATWKRGWDLYESDGQKLLNELEDKKLIKEFDFNNNYHYTKMLKKNISGGNNAWDVCWYASAFVKNKLTLYPGKSLVDNIGQDASGTHSKSSNIFRTTVSENKVNIKKIPIEENAKAKNIIIKYLGSLKPNIFKRILKKIYE